MFCFVFRKFLTDSPGFAEKMVYYVLATLNAYTERSFELILDVTGMTERNMPDVSRGEGGGEGLEGRVEVMGVEGRVEVRDWRGGWR